MIKPLVELTEGASDEVAKPNPDPDSNTSAAAEANADGSPMLNAPAWIYRDNAGGASAQIMSQQRNGILGYHCT